MQEEFRCECNELKFQKRIENQSFLYGETGKAVELNAKVPVWFCDSCSAAFTEGEAENARHEAVCLHLGLLNPKEIRSIRENQCLTRAEFAKLTGIDEISIEKWESGSVLQNAASDKFLRLLQDETIFSKLKALNHLSASEK